MSRIRRASAGPPRYTFAVITPPIADSTGDGVRSHRVGSSFIDVNHRSSVIRVMWVSLPARRASRARASAIGIVGMYE